MDEVMVARALEYARRAFAGDCSGHDFYHTLRVFRTASRIAREEGADLATVQLAAILHDVDDRKLSPQTAGDRARAAQFLRSEGVAEADIARILRIIAEVSFAGADSVTPSDIEGRCVQDADRLDAMGAIGIARAFAYGGSRGRPIHDPNEAPGRHLSREAYERSQSSSVNHFYEKLLLLKDMMTTGAGRRIAAHRHAVMEEFLQEFFAEWEGADWPGESE